MGKLSLFLVLGFSILYIILGNSSSKLSTQTVENMADYNANTVAHNIAVSGTNLACNQLFQNSTWDDGYSGINFENGNFSASIQVLDPWRNIRKLTTTANYGGVNKNIEVIFQPSSFSKFAYLSISDPTNLYWSGKDTIWGPFHSEGNINAFQHPVFKGKATTKGTVKYLNSKAADEPYFLGGFESGVSLTFPPSGLDNIKSLANSDGHVFTGKDTVYVTFVGDSIKYRFNNNAKPTTVLASSFAPNGIIYAENSILRLQGVVKGRYTVACNGTSPKGNIYLDDNLTYSSDPRINPKSQDMLGIVSKNNVLITENTANKSSINIHASIYCEKGGFGAGWPAFTKPNGNINLLGGIQNYSRVQIGKINGSEIWGFARQYKYDDRLMIASPPGYPGTGQLEIVSWFE
ncbi:MAG: hypothetical protein ACHQLA_02275 [Ignavibacteriales bacterium]